MQSRANYKEMIFRPLWNVGGGSRKLTSRLAKGGNFALIEHSCYWFGRFHFKILDMSEKEPPSHDVPTSDVETTEAEPVEPEEAGESAASADHASDLMERLEAAEARAAEMQDKSLRAFAELDNFRKRMARDRQELLKTAAADVIESLLPALDNLKIGLAAADNHPEAGEVTKGFEMVGQQILSALQEHGLKEIDPSGEPFDPHFHDSLTTQPSEAVEEGGVIQTIKVGYMLNDKMLRPAAVVVSSGKPETSGE